MAETPVIKAGKADLIFYLDYPVLFRYADPGKDVFITIVLRKTKGITDANLYCDGL
jgi:hypothetical protein